MLEFKSIAYLSCNGEETPAVWSAAADVHRNSKTILCDTNICNKFDNPKIVYFESCGPRIVLLIAMEQKLAVKICMDLCNAVMGRDP